MRCLCVIVCEEPERKAHRAAGSNHHSSFGVFELKYVYSKGKAIGISAACKKHTCVSDSNDCARTLMFSDKLAEDDIVQRLRTWLAVGASIHKVSVGMCFDSCVCVAL